MGEINDQKCKWYQNDQEGLKRGRKLVFLNFNFFGESAAECKYAANFTDVLYHCYM